ncbi:unnamed protein product [Symbiodinium sp. CCMP2592]|nr:unnamed protein product [Symbiodinium sp. CCMP2592]
MRRRLQTEKARIAVAASRVAKSKDAEVAAATNCMPPEPFQSRLQREQFTRLFVRTKYGTTFMDKDERHQFSRERARCVKSFLQAMVDAVVKLFRGSSGSDALPMKHVLNTVVSDDTTTKLKAQGRPGFDQSVVYTVMNTSQSLVLRYADGATQCMHMPTPLQILPSGKAKSIHEAFKAWLLITGTGVGGRLLSLQCPANLASQSPWQTLVLMGDALKANNTAWNMEKNSLLQRRRETDSADVPHRTLGLRLKCLNHQCALIRRPLVLSIERYWATLVRLGHLFELNSFRRSFAGALISLVQQPGNFVRIPVAAFPPEMPVWQKRTAWILRDYQSTSLGAQKLARSPLDFANGDSTKDVIVHHCLLPREGEPPCCSSHDESVCKFLAQAVPLLSRGFPTPLLYRMKHYGPASSYMKLAGSCFGLLRRVLCEMESSAVQSANDGELAQYVDAFLQDSSRPGGVAPAEENYWQHLLASALDSDRDFAAQNGARRRMVIHEISKPSFQQASIVIDCLIQPLEHGINTLLSHTRILHDLTFLGKGHPEYQELCSKSRGLFLRCMSGHFGDQMLREYTVIMERGLFELIDMGFEATDDSLNKIFDAIVLLCTDLHRRCNYELSRAPFKLFKLCDLDLAAFLDAWAALEAEAVACQNCVDHELTTVLLKKFSGLQVKTVEEQMASQSEIVSLLSDISTFSPTTSDAVELKNGQLQWVVSKRASQNVRNGRTAVEMSLLHSAVAQNQWVQSAAGVETMPSKATASSIKKMSGVKTQQTEDGKSRTKTTRETAQDKHLRLDKAGKRKIRSICAWNVFQREGRAGQSLKGDEYHARIRELSAQWRRMSSEEKQPFVVKAAHQQTLLDELEQKPLDSAATTKAKAAEGAADAAPVDSAWKNACKKRSLRRLELNTASLIDIRTTDENIADFLQETMHKPLSAAQADMQAEDLEEEDAPTQAQCCPELCMQHPLYGLVEEWRSCLRRHLEHRNIKSSALVTFTSSTFPSCLAYVLGVALKRPALRMLMKVSVHEREESEVKFELRNGAPVIETDRQVMLQLLQMAGGASDTCIQVEVWSLQAKIRGQCELYAAPQDHVCSFNLDVKIPQKAKRGPVVLPFGVKVPKPKRKQKKAKPKSEVVRKRKTTDKKAAQEVSDDEASDSDSEAADPAETLEDGDRVVLADSVREEEKQLPALQQEIDNADAARAEIAASIRANQPVPGRTSSFFAKELGLDSGALAASGRSVCLSCKSAIAKNSVRFSWHHSLYRPPGWVHGSCVIDFVKTTGLKEVALRRLDNILQMSSASSSSSAPAVPNQVVEMARSIRQALSA